MDHRRRELCAARIAGRDEEFLVGTAFLPLPEWSALGDIDSRSGAVPVCHQAPPSPWVPVPVAAETLGSIERRH
jgi:hypothetical protein